MNSDETILKMLREVRDLRVCRAGLWALNFGRETHEIEAMIEIVRAERVAEAA